MTIALLGLAAGFECNAKPQTAAVPQAGGTTMSTAVKTLTVQSSAFPHNGTIPRKYTEDGDNISPPLTWSGLPQGVRELALIVDDPDAPRPQPWVHWVIYKIAANVGGLRENIPPKQKLLMPDDAVQGMNSWNRIGYGGPAPPKGHGVHHYHFKLYALDASVKLDPGATKEALLSAMQGHVIAEGELIGTYQR